MSAAHTTSIYIASPEGDTGKSTVALGILHRLTAMVPRAGVFRPITRRENRDYILRNARQARASLQGLAGLSRSEARERIARACHEESPA